jgi:hypothetical protein
MRIFLIVVGSVLLITGFMFLLSLVLIFIAKIPGAFSSNSVDFNIMYLPDFMSYLVSPSVYPWIMLLAAIVVILPVAAVIYWGVKMIFWFRANDRILSLTLLIVWALSLTALTILLLNEGVSFAENSKSTVKLPLNNNADTVYFITDRNVSALINEKSLPFSTDDYSLYINDEKKELYITPHLRIEVPEEEQTGLYVCKESFGNNEIAAFNRAGEIQYGYSLKGDTIVLDDYFTYPTGRKWAADYVDITVKLPAGTIVKTDPGVERLLNWDRCHENDQKYYPLEKRDGFSCWKVTEDGLMPLTGITENQN